MVKEQKKENDQFKRVTRKRSNSDVIKDYTTKKKTGPSSYRLYSKEERYKLKEVNPNVDSKEITAMIKEQWSKLDQNEKDRYTIAVGSSA